METFNELLAGVLNQEKTFDELLSYTQRKLAKSQDPKVQAVLLYDAWLCINNSYFNLTELKQRLEGL